MHRTKRNILLGFIGFLLILIVGVVSVSYYMTMKLIHPNHKVVDINPSDVGLPYSNVTFQSYDGAVSLKGWQIPSSTTTHKWIITSHGYTGDRLIWPDQGTPKGEPGLTFFQFLHAHNYNILTFDYRNSGESGGDTTSVGYYEQEDLLGAIDSIVKKDKDAEIALMGWSQGAATTLLAAPHAPSNVKLAVVDSSFSNLGTYLSTNLPKFSHLPGFPFNDLILKFWIPTILHLSPNTVSPIVEAEQIPCPLLLVGSTTDALIPYSNSQTIYASTSKDHDVTLDTFDGPGHTLEFVDQPNLYEKDLLDFFEKHNF